MTLASDIASDYLYLDGVETVTYTPQNPAGTPQAAVSGLQRMLNKSQFYSVIFAPDDIATRWHLWAVTMTGGTAVKIGDKITGADAKVWIIKSVSYSPQTSRWICDCILEVS